MSHPTNAEKAIQAPPAMLDIDLSDRQGRALLAATAQEFGAPLAVAAHRLHRLFLLRSPWAPGLRFAGGQAVHDGGPDALCDRRVFSQSGPAETLEAAIASCVGEAVEAALADRAAWRRRADGPADEVAADSCPPEVALSPSNSTRAASPVSPPLDWMTGRALTTGRDLLVPADWCLRRAPLRMRLAATVDPRQWRCRRTGLGLGRVPRPARADRARCRRAVVAWRPPRPADRLARSCADRSSPVGHSPASGPDRAPRAGCSISPPTSAFPASSPCRAIATAVDSPAASAPA